MLFQANETPQLLVAYLHITCVLLTTLSHLTNNIASSPVAASVDWTRRDKVDPVVNMNSVDPNTVIGQLQAILSMIYGKLLR